MASEQLAEMEKYKYEVDIKLKDHHSIEQQKTDLERHVQSLIKVSPVKYSLTDLHTARLSMLKLGNGFKICVCYVHTPHGRRSGFETWPETLHWVHGQDT